MTAAAMARSSEKTSRHRLRPAKLAGSTQSNAFVCERQAAKTAMRLMIIRPTRLNKPMPKKIVRHG